jgi:hypothetical protein
MRTLFLIVIFVALCEVAILANAQELAPYVISHPTERSGVPAPVRVWRCVESDTHAVSFQNRRCDLSAYADKPSLWGVGGNTVVVVSAREKHERDVAERARIDPAKAGGTHGPTGKLRERFSWKGQGAAVELPDTEPHHTQQ